MSLQQVFIVVPRFFDLALTLDFTVCFAAAEENL